jgi:hypothetical protein
MSFEITNVFGQNTTPAARVSSAIMSILILALIIFNIINDNFKSYAYTFIAFHLINNLLASIEDLKIPTCPQCSKQLEYQKVIKLHKCETLEKE